WRTMNFGACQAKSKAEQLSEFSGAIRTRSASPTPRHTKAGSVRRSGRKGSAFGRDFIPWCIDRSTTTSIAGLGLVSAGVSAPTQIGVFKLTRYRRECERRSAPSCWHWPSRRDRAKCVDWEVGYPWIPGMLHIDYSNLRLLLIATAAKRTYAKSTSSHFHTCRCRARRYASNRNGSHRMTCSRFTTPSGDCGRSRSYQPLNAPTRLFGGSIQSPPACS